MVIAVDVVLTSALVDTVSFKGSIHQEYIKIACVEYCYLVENRDNGVPLNHFLVAVINLCEDFNMNTYH